MLAKMMLLPLPIPVLLNCLRVLLVGFSCGDACVETPLLGLLNALWIMRGLIWRGTGVGADIYGEFIMCYWGWWAGSNCEEDPLRLVVVVAFAKGFIQKLFLIY